MARIEIRPQPREWEGSLWTMTLIVCDGGLVPSFSPSVAVTRWMKRQSDWQLVTPVEYYEQFTDDGYGGVFGWRAVAAGFDLIVPDDVAKKFHKSFKLAQHEYHICMA